MRKLFTASLLILGLALGLTAVGQEAGDPAASDPAASDPAASDPAAERKAKILANLQAKFPQLKQANVVMGDIEPSGYGSLDKGSFSINSQQTQQFLVSQDDKALYMITDPIDVSLSAEQIAVQEAEKAAEEAKQATTRAQEIEEMVAGLPFRGNPDAPVTIVEWSDFQCPYCSRGAATVEQILEKYPNDVKFVFQHFPLGFHPWAKPAAIAADCAAKQKPEAFWSLHDKYFENQKALNPGNLMAKSKEFLAESGIDLAKWSTCADDKESEEYKAVAASVEASMKAGQKHGVSGTPGFFVNGQFLNGAQPLSAFEPLIAEAKKNAGS